MAHKVRAKRPVKKTISPSIKEQMSIRKPAVARHVGVRAAEKNKSTPALPEQDLHARLVTAAARCVEEGGLAGVKARELATYAGCSPGMIYYAFADLDALIVALNRETRNRLDEALISVLVEDPRQNLDRLALAYLRFAHANKQLWRALFEFRVRTGKTVPEDYQADIMMTFSRIAQMLGAIFPDRDPAELDMSSRALFSAVHGIVALGLDENYVAVPLAKMEDRSAISWQFS